MNLGQAVAVCCYELARNAAAARREPKPAQAAPSDALDLITNRLLDLLAASGYIQPRTEASTQLKIRRLVRRMNLSGKDAEVWLGILRQALWKLRS
jgi:tRNA/rRNA methyltransferase